KTVLSVLILRKTSGSAKMSAMWTALRPSLVLATAAVSAIGIGLAPSAFASSTTGTHGPGYCSAGAHTLSSHGARLYPETGNGGYRSVHTGVHMVYDAGTNTFLAGNNVALTDQATQCLSSFSLDFERSSANTSAGPDLAVSSVTVNGRPARFAFEQPTYPGDPNGPNDPDPRAGQESVAAGLHPRARQLAERHRTRRHPVPGRQARRHAHVPAPGRRVL